jgi:hypothetical protein
MSQCANSTEPTATPCSDGSELSNASWDIGRSVLARRRRHSRSVGACPSPSNLRAIPNNSNAEDFPAGKHEEMTQCKSSTRTSLSKALTTAIPCEMASFFNREDGPYSRALNMFEMELQAQQQQKTIRTGRRNRAFSTPIPIPVVLDANRPLFKPRLSKVNEPTEVDSCDFQCSDSSSIVQSDSCQVNKSQELSAQSEVLDASAAKLSPVPALLPEAGILKSSLSAALANCRRTTML